MARAQLDKAPADVAGMFADVADFVAFRRSVILAHQREGEVPAPQAASATVVLSEIRHAGAADGDFVELANPSASAAVERATMRTGPSASCGSGRRNSG